MVSSINSSSAAYSQMQISRPPKPDASKMAAKMFRLLDTKNQGFIDKDELSTALQKVDQSASGSAPLTADDAFKQLDTNGDGQISKQEFADDLKKMLDDVDAQRQAAGGVHHAGHHHGTGAMSFADASAGLSKDYLSSAAAAATDPSAKNQLDDLIANFTAIDTDQDSKVSAKEVLAYKQAQFSAQQATTTPAASNQAADLKMLRMIMQITNSYGSNTASATASAQSSSMSVTA